jgi:hypothetical protein
MWHGKQVKAQYLEYNIKSPFRCSESFIIYNHCFLLKRFSIEYFLKHCLTLLLYFLKQYNILEQGETCPFFFVEGHISKCQKAPSSEAWGITEICLIIDKTLISELFEIIRI